MDAYPGGMSRLTRNKLWFAPAVSGMPASALNNFVDWVAENKPVRDRAFVHDMDVRAVFIEYTESIRVH